jgi:hypothetical protein
VFTLAADCTRNFLFVPIASVPASARSTMAYMPYNRQIRLRPSEINYSQRKIIQLFGNGWKSLPETFGEIVAGKLTVDDLPPISVFVHRNAWWVYSGNRRLRVFKELESYGVIKTIPVIGVQNPLSIKDPTWVIIIFVCVDILKFRWCDLRRCICVELRKIRTVVKCNLYARLTLSAAVCWYFVASFQRLL